MPLGDREHFALPGARNGLRDLKFEAATLDDLLVWVDGLSSAFKVEHESALKFEQSLVLRK